MFYTNRIKGEKHVKMTLNDVQDKMSKTLNNLKNQLSGISSCINLKLISSTKIIDSTGQSIPIEEIAILRRKDNLIIITPYNPAESNNIEKILKQHNFSVFMFSKKDVAVSIPYPSKEEQEKIKVLIKRAGEAAKISIRNIRKSYRQSKSKCDIIEDITANYITDIDNFIEGKIKSL